MGWELEQTGNSAFMADIAGMQLAFAEHRIESRTASARCGSDRPIPRPPVVLHIVAEASDDEPTDVSNHASVEFLHGWHSV